MSTPAVARWYRNPNSFWWRGLNNRTQQTIQREGKSWRYDLYMTRELDGWGRVANWDFETLREAKEWADRDPMLTQDGRVVP